MKTLCGEIKNGNNIIYYFKLDSISRTRLKELMVWSNSMADRTEDLIFEDYSVYIRESGELRKLTSYTTIFYTKGKNFFI